MMNYTQLIVQACERFNLPADNLYTVTVNHKDRIVVILTRQFAKFVAPFPVEDPDEFNQDPEPRPKRVKAVKRAR